MTGYVHSCEWLEATLCVKLQLPLYTRIAYGLSAIASAAMSTSQSNLLIFYSSVLGLRQDLTTLAIGLSSVLDGMTDPLMAFASDNMRTRWGRRHPMMFVAVVPACLANMMLWSPPAKGASSGTLFWHLFSSLFLFNTAVSLFDIPSGALVNELSTDAHERTALINTRTAFGWLSGTALAVYIARCLLVPSEAGAQDGFFNEGGYRAIGGLTATVMGLAMVVSAVATSPHIQHLSRQAPRQITSWRELLGRFLEPLQIHNVRVCFGASIALALEQGIMFGLMPYYVVFFFGFTPGESAWFKIAGILSVVISFSVTPNLSRSLGKWRAIKRLVYVQLVCNPLPILLRALGLLFDNGTSGLFYFFALYSIGAGTVIISMGTLNSSLMMDMVEEGAERTGRRDEAVFFMAISFCSRVVSAVGLWMSGFIVSAAGISGKPSGGGTITAAQSRTLAMLHIPVGIGVGVTALRIFMRYRPEDTSAAMAALARRVRQREQVPTYSDAGVAHHEQLAVGRRGAAAHRASGMVALADEDPRPDEHEEAELHASSSRRSDEPPKIELV